ncbi:MAG TPA: type II secretion system protein GspJ [Verrucomicrobiae bacterium]|nr:type II secretion system protein GspJ [Verrucomicrobiae bacterium]
MKLGTKNLSANNLRVRDRQAFTLIEVMLAIGISGIVLVSVSSVLFTALHLRDSTADMVDAAAPVDSTVTFLKRDLQNCVVPTNGTSKVLSGSFRAGEGTVSDSGPVSVEMYTTTGALSEKEPWAEIQRVTYELKTPAIASAGRDLYRSVTRNLLSSGTPEVTDQLMLNNVADLKFTCYDGAIWQPTWDTSSATAVNTNLPQAVKVDIQMAGNPPPAPVEIVVPLDCVARTNMVLVTTTSN